jgi:glutamine amidotransferase
MCRIAGYFGSPIPLSAWMTEPSHGLVHQARHAREMAAPGIAGDGWGAGWFPADGRRGPGLLKSPLPIWADLNVKSALPAVSAGSALGHIRLASPGSEVCLLNTPLYVLDDHLYTLNGELSPWPGPLGMDIRRRLDPDHEAAVQGSTDAELLGALWRTQFRRAGGRDAAGALRETIRLARALVAERDGKLKVNVLLAGPDSLVAIRYAAPDPEEADSLYYLEGRDRWPGLLVASEPLDDGPGWRRVEPSTLLRVGREGLAVEPIGVPEG